ncbi:MAG: DNA adenine methylase [Bacteroidetes bacterium]|nr:DNA adenine methylase [Bacteroidota bacterium]
MQTSILTEPEVAPSGLSRYTPPSRQLLKWIGNKQKFAREITSYFPSDIRRYIEPFLGSGAVLATVAPQSGLGSDTFKPLVEIWQMLSSNPEGLIEWYAERRALLSSMTKEDAYLKVRASYNAKPNGADFLFLTRTCYGGVVRFRKADGFMSTPCGAHTPIPTTSFAKRAHEWATRMKYSTFEHLDYREAFDLARRGDFIYCDPPYSHSQTILYGAQAFKLQELFEAIDKAKSKGVRVALSIDGTKKSGDIHCAIDAPDELFERELYIDGGRSMLKRFQMEGSTLEAEVVSDRLLLTY